MIDGLKRNPNVDLLNVKFGEPASSEEIAEATRLAGGRLPVGVEEFYRQVGSFSLEWRHTVAEIREGDQADEGLVNIIPLSAVFGDWEDYVYFPDFPNGEGLEFRPVKPFDAFVAEACAAFLQPDGQPVGDSVAYHYFGEDLHDLGYTFDEYIERMLVSRGYWYWMLTLSAELQRDHEVGEFRRKMPLVFDDYDDSLFQPR